MEVVGAGRQFLDAPHRARLSRAQQVAPELAVVVDQVVLGDVVEVGEGELVALAHGDRGGGVVHRHRVCVLLGRTGIRRAQPPERRQRGDD